MCNGDGMVQRFVKTHTPFQGLLLCMYRPEEKKFTKRKKLAFAENQVIIMGLLQFYVNLVNFFQPTTNLQMQKTSRQTKAYPIW